LQEERVLQRIAEILLQASKQTGLEINIDETKYTLT
jgi:hypothetical protein